MKLYFSLLIMSTLYIQSHAQKSLIDTNTYKSWVTVENSAIISNNGKYVAYSISNLPSGQHTLVIKNIESKFETHVTSTNALQPKFTADNRSLLFIDAKDSLNIMNLVTGKTEEIPNVSKFDTVNDPGSGTFVYSTKDSSKTLILRNSSISNISSFQGITDYSISENGKTLLMQTGSSEYSSQVQTLKWFSLDQKSLKTIWQGTGLGSHNFDQEAKRLIFITASKGQGRIASSLWIYKTGDDSARELINSNRNSFVNRKPYVYSEAIFVNDNSSRIWLICADQESIAEKSGLPSVDIYNWSDDKLQSLQVEESKRTYGNYFTTILYTDNLHDVPLTKENEEFSYNPVSLKEYVLVKENKGDDLEWLWKPNSRSKTFLISTRDGSKHIMSDDSSFGSFQLSPTGKFVVYFAPQVKNFFCYETKSGITRNVSAHASTDWLQHLEQRSDKYLPVSYPDVWTKDDEALIIHDNYDLWQIDPKGIKEPINLTNGFGRINHIEFYLIKDIYAKPLEADATIVVSAYNTETKDYGFYQFRLGKSQNPQKLNMGPYMYSGSTFGGFMPPVKAADAEAYVVTRMNTVNAPNYFVTKDFTHFDPISSVVPQQNYNWMTSELISWKTTDGHSSQAVLLKPENFDPHKKYPVVFYFYELSTDRLNEFMSPMPNGYSINIPYFLSHGYLVCLPDIHFKVGYPGQSSLSYVSSVARFLSKQPWVDSSKLGIQGHSFGGFQVDYIITHSNMFRAAVAGSGMTDFISAYGSTLGSGHSRQQQYEMFRDRVGYTLWERPDLYIENSPVLKANHVTTPVLIMANKMDKDVPYAQGVEFFDGLRRLQKKCWMLQYDDEGHVVDNEMNQADYDIRIIQFFDHFLKGAPEPRWMSEGVPAIRKGIDRGLDFGSATK